VFTREVLQRTLEVLVERAIELGGDTPLTADGREVRMVMNAEVANEY